MSYTNKEFNPSGSVVVDRIKEAAEVLAMEIAHCCPEGTLKDKALLDVQSASMFAVKSLFNTPVEEVKPTEPEAEQEYDGTLEDWVKVDSLIGDYYVGKLYNDTKGRWPDGTLIRTSLIVDITGNHAHGKVVVQTLNSIYRLGKKRNT